MKGNWEKCFLEGETSLITKGTTPTSLGKDFKESGINFIKAESITNSGKFIPESFAFIDEDTHKILKRSQLEVEDILFSIAGVLGRVGVVDKTIIPANTNQALAIIRLSSNTELDRKYIKFYLNSSYIKDQIRRINVQAAQANFSLGDISRLIIKYPPLPQQRKISNILSTCDRVIEKTEAAITKYQAIKQGLMHDLFSRGIDLKTGKLRPKYEDAPDLYQKSALGMIPKEWEVKRVDEFSEVISGGTPSSSVQEFWNGDILWVTPSDLSKLKFGYISNSERTITRQGLNSSSALLIPKGSIVLSSRAPIGYCAIVEDEFTTNQGCKSISLYENNVAEYFYFNIIQHVNRIKLKGEGTTFSEISKKELEKILFTRCDLKEQKLIADKLVSCDEKIQTEQSTLSKYREIKSGLMQDLLSGEVEVKVEKEKEVVE